MSPIVSSCRAGLTNVDEAADSSACHNQVPSSQKETQLTLLLHRRQLPGRRRHGAAPVGCCRQVHRRRRRRRRRRRWTCHRRQRSPPAWPASRRTARCRGRCGRPSRAPASRRGTPCRPRRSRPILKRAGVERGWLGPLLNTAVNFCDTRSGTLLSEWDDRNGNRSAQSI
jgi:hypothetical protein